MLKDDSPKEMKAKIDAAEEAINAMREELRLSIAVQSTQNSPTSRHSRPDIIITTKQTEPTVESLENSD